VSEHYEWSLTMPLPDATPDDPYDPDEFAELLREVADRVAGEEMPPTGVLWDSKGRLLGHASLGERPVAPAGRAPNQRRQP
jgi:hypothetical protein